MYRYVGTYLLGLPAFGPNILRSMHVTAVLTKAVKEGKKHDDPEVVNLFSLARHGIFEREKTYNTVKHDLQVADGDTFQGQNHGLAQTYGEGDESVTAGDRDDFLNLFEREAGFGEIKHGAKQVANRTRMMQPSMEAFFGPEGVAGFFRQFWGEMKRMRTCPDASDEDDDPEFVRDKKRLKELKKQIKRKKIKEEIAECERTLDGFRDGGVSRVYEQPTCKGKKRPVGEVLSNFQSRKSTIGGSRMKRSTESTDAAKLEVLREMHALYTSAVGKECIFPKGALYFSTTTRRRI